MHLVIGCSEAPPHVLIVQDLHLEGEVFLQVLNDEYEERQLDAQSLRLISRAADVGCANICRLEFQDTGGNIGVRDALNMSIPHCRRKTTLYSDGQLTPRKACV